jgi:hypothetical protein
MSVFNIVSKNEGNSSRQSVALKHITSNFPQLRQLVELRGGVVSVPARMWWPTELVGGGGGGWGGAGIGSWRDAGGAVGKLLVTRLRYAGCPEEAATWETAEVSAGVMVGLVVGIERWARLQLAELGRQLNGNDCRFYVRNGEAPAYTGGLQMDPLSGLRISISEGRQAALNQLRAGRQRWAVISQKEAAMARRLERAKRPLVWSPFASLQVA